jgi:acetylglutamate kinase
LDGQQEAINKADILIEAMGWIRRFRGKTTVIKLGGSLMGNPDAMRHTLIDIIFMETVGMRPVVVHGGGPSINKAMEAAAIEPVWVKGRRVTDAKTLSIVEQTLGYELNTFLADEIERFGGRAMNLNFRSTNVLFGEKLLLEEPGSDPIDLGFVGEVTRVDRQTIESLTYTGQIPIIPSMCIDDAGQKYNVNALGTEGVLSCQAAISIHAYRHDMEIQGDDRLSRKLCEKPVGDRTDRQHQ